MPGRWADVRAPSENELSATAVLAIPIDEASAKVRSGGPMDDEEDYALPAWAGVIPLTSGVGRRSRTRGCARASRPRST